jgi:hypothetical protein
MNPLHYRILTLLFALVPPLACAHSASADPASLVTQTLTLGGRDKMSVTLTPESLKAYPVQNVPDIALKNRKGETQRVLKGYNGVKLVDLLDKAALISTDPNDFKKTIIVATASDGYKAVFSWNEPKTLAAGPDMCAGSKTSRSARSTDSRPWQSVDDEHPPAIFCNWNPNETFSLIYGPAVYPCLPDFSGARRRSNDCGCGQLHRADAKNCR